MTDNLLTNPTGLNTGIGVVGGYNQPQKNIQQALTDNVINKVKNFIDGKSLLKLNETVFKVLKKYTIVVDSNDEKIEDINTINQELLSRFLEAKTLEGCSPRTITYYEMEDNKFFEFIQKSILDITAEDIRDYLSFNKKLGTVSNRTLDNKRRVLNTTFQWFCDEGFIMLNPLVGINKIRHKKKVNEPFTPDEIEKMREILLKKPETTEKQKQRKLRDLAIFELLLSSGIRVNELVGLNRSSINLNSNSMVVYGKGAKQREAYFNSKTKNVLERYLKTRTDNDVCLFIGRKSKKNGSRRLGVNGVERVIRGVGREAGVKAHPHKFRRHMACSLLSKGVPLEQIKVLLGHANIDTTTIYAITDKKEVEMNHKNLIG